MQFHFFALSWTKLSGTRIQCQSTNHGGESWRVGSHLSKNDLWWNHVSWWGDQGLSNSYLTSHCLWIWTSEVWKWSRLQKSSTIEGWSNKKKKTTDWRIEHCKDEEDWWTEPHLTTERWFRQVNYRSWRNITCSKDEVISSESQFFQEGCRGKDSCWWCLFHWKDGGRNKTTKVDGTHYDSWWALLFSLFLQGGGHYERLIFSFKLAKTSWLLCVVCC